MNGTHTQNSSNFTHNFNDIVLYTLHRADKSPNSSFSVCIFKNIEYKVGHLEYDFDVYYKVSEGDVCADGE